MMFLVLVPLFCAALCSVLPREPMLRRWRTARLRATRAIRHRTTRVSLPEDWWEQFERDLQAYADPHAAQARKNERS